MPITLELSFFADMACTGLLSLPSEIIVYICKLMQTTDIIALSRTCCHLGRAAHNIELWRGQFTRPHGAAILDDLCSIWADMHIEADEDMKWLVLENVLSALSTTSAEDYCNIYVQTPGGRELVLTPDGLSDLKRFEDLLSVRTSVSVTKLVDRAGGHLQPHQLSTIAHRVDLNMKYCNLQKVSLNSVSCVNDMVSILGKTKEWYIDEMHIRDHELSTMHAALVANGIVRVLAVYMTGGYLQSVCTMQSLQNMYKISHSVQLVIGDIQHATPNENQSGIAVCHFRGKKFGGDWNQIVKTAVQTMQLPKCYYKMLVASTAE